MVDAPCVWDDSSSVGLSTDELASHSHSAVISSAGNHNHGIKRWMGYTNKTSEQKNEGTGTGYYQGEPGNTTTTEMAGAHAHTATIGNTGENASHENRPPFEAVIRWKRTA